MPPIPSNLPGSAADERSQLRKEVANRVFSFDTISEEDVPEVPSLPSDPSIPSLSRRPPQQPQVAIEIPVLLNQNSQRPQQSVPNNGDEREMLRSQINIQQFENLYNFGTRFILV